MTLPIPLDESEPITLLRKIADTLTTLSSQLATPASPQRASLMSIEDVAAYLNISKRSVEQLIAEGKLTPIYVLSVRRFTHEAIDAFLRTSKRRAA